MKLFSALGITAVAMILLLGCEQSTPATSPDLRPNGKKPTAVAAETEQANASHLNKVDDKLRKLVMAWSTGEDVTQMAQTQGIKITKNKEVSVDVYVTNPVNDASAQLTSLGMTVQAVNESHGVVEGLLPISQVMEVARLDNTKAVLLVTAFGTDKVP